MQPTEGRCLGRRPQLAKIEAAPRCNWVGNQAGGIVGTTPACSAVDRGRIAEASALARGRSPAPCVRWRAWCRKPFFTAMLKLYGGAAARFAPLAFVSSHQLIAKMKPKRTRYAMLPLSSRRAAAGEGCVTSLPPPDPLRPSCPHREEQSGRLPTRGRSLRSLYASLSAPPPCGGPLSFGLAYRIKYL